MLEYGLAIILIGVTLLSAFISAKVPLLGMAVILIDLVMLRELAINGTVIIGYGVVNGGIQTITQQFIELQLTTLIAIMLNIAGTIYGAWTKLK